jgi:stage II sporulation protein R
MKKILVVVLISLVLLIMNSNYYIIPNEAIRFRIISNSNSSEDIIMKEKTMQETVNLFEDFKYDSINNTRNDIVNNIKNIENNISKLFSDNNYNKTFNIRYGLNEFPEKTYKGVKYEKGLYESLLIEIGNAKGNNYWCVLYPPLCLIDESNEKIEYKSKIIEIFNKLF